MSLFPQFGKLYLKKVLKAREMLTMLFNFLEKVTETGEMLIMLIMLIIFGTFREGIHKQTGPKR